MLRFDSREKVNGLGLYVDPEAKLVLSGSSPISYKEAQ
jgi:hypothetical protein